MEQFEALVAAAQRIGPAARPLPLFYALSQAGRAIAAAHGGEPWRLRGHGLQFPSDGSPLLGRRVRPDNKAGSSFRRVSEVTGSDILDTPVTLGALCASLPDLAMVDALCGSHPRALAVQAIRKSSGISLVMSRAVDAYVVNLPHDVLTANAPETVLKEHLGHYPSAAGWTAPDGLRVLPPQQGWGAGAVLRWTVAEDIAGPNERQRQERVLEVAPQYLHADSQWCRPAVAPLVVLSPLMTWWALLFALSMVARYEPDHWVGLLDVDGSSLAVPLEQVLEDALEVVPHLVLNALGSIPLLLEPQPHYGA